MNTLDDLRTALATHAETITDTAAAARTASVVERARAARRRRATNSLIGAVVVAVAAAGIAIPLTRVHRSAPVPAGDIRVSGIDVPKQVTLDEFGYAYASMTAAPASKATGVVKERRFKVKVPASSRNQAVLLVGTGLGRGTVTLEDVNGAAVDRIVGDGTSADRTGTPIPLPASAITQRYTLVSRGVPAYAKIGLETYGRTAALPPGVSHGDSVFRYRIGGRTLVAAKWAKPGQTRVSLHVHGNLSHDLLVAYCRSTDPHAIYGIGPGAGRLRFLGAGGCGSTSDEDPGHDANVLGPGGNLAARHRLVLVVGTSDGQNELTGMRPIASDDVRALGFAVYRMGPATHVLGMSLEHTIDYDGSSWHLVQIEHSGGATGRHVYRNRSDVPTVFALVATGHGGVVTTTTRLPGASMPTMGDGGGAMSWNAGPFLPDGRYSITVHSQHPIRTALAIYEPASGRSAN